MSAGIWFWIIYVLCVLFGAWVDWPQSPEARWPFGRTLVIFVLLGLLGWGIFGPPIK